MKLVAPDVDLMTVTEKDFPIIRLVGMNFRRGKLWLTMINYGLSRCQWEFKDPKMEVLYHIFGHILLGYSLT